MPSSPKEYISPWHDLHHCTKLQLSTKCSFGVMTQTRHKFRSGKSARTGICTIVRVKKPNLHIALKVSDLKC